MCPSRHALTSSVLLIALAPLLAGDKKADLKMEMERLKSPFASEIITAARTIATLGADGEAAIPAMAQAMHRLPFGDDRIAVARAISRMGPAAAVAVPSMAHTIEMAPFPKERLAMIRILGDMGPAAKDAVPTLTKSLRATFADERRAAADALGKIGPAAKAAIPALTEASQTGFGDVRPIAKEALRRIQATDGRTGVIDQAKLFSPILLRGQQAEVLVLARRHEIDLLVETLATPPKEPPARTRKEPGEPQQFDVAHWAHERALERQLDGVYVLITREPMHVYVVTAGRGKKLLDDEGVKNLTETLLNDFKFRRYDHGLANGLKALRDHLGSGLRDTGLSGGLRPGVYDR